jgi:hypothetical protein
MTAVFLFTFVAGLLLGVRAMLLGVERQAPLGTTPPPSPVLRSSTAVLAGFAIAFGAVGYLATRPGRLGMLPGTMAAVAAGVVAAVGAAWLVRRAAAFVPEHDPDDPRYVLQGHVATVLRAISANAPGEISYILEGREHVVAARGLDGVTVALGEEVVIERLDEDGTAWVEPWHAVEQRL